MPTPRLTIRYGRIVYAWIEDRNGHGKLRPALIVTPDEEISESPFVKLNDSHLRERGLDPSRVRYWFKKQHGMTFQGYLRMLRIGQAFGRIKHGEKVVSTAFDSGAAKVKEAMDARFLTLFQQHGLASGGPPTAPSQ